MTAVGLVAAGDMGAALGRVLAEHGVEVRTLLAGRSAATAARARAAGMKPVSQAELVESDIILSVLPPAQAMGFARAIAPALAAAERKPAYVECNPLSPAAVRKIEAVIAATGAPFADGGIVGLTPRPGYPGPVIYVSGPAAEAAMALEPHGLRIRRVDGPVGAASALKLSYAAITKGLFGIASAAILAAEREGVAPAFHDELSASQPALTQMFTRSIPDMFGKAGRWVAEMEEIAVYFGADRPEGELFAALARFYRRVSEDHNATGPETRTLDAFFKSGAGKQ